MAVCKKGAQCITCLGSAIQVAGTGPRTRCAAQAARSALLSPQVRVALLARLVQHPHAVRPSQPKHSTARTQQSVQAARSALLSPLVTVAVLARLEHPHAVHPSQPEHSTAVGKANAAFM
jgi:hypothetical protein